MIRSDKTSDKLLPCPFCGIDCMYEIIIDNEFGDPEPALFCNACKMIFQVENDSPHMKVDETYKYLKEKLYKTFNTRKSMERIVERLEELRKSNLDMGKVCKSQPLKMAYLGRSAAYENAMEIVKEEMN